MMKLIFAALCCSLVLLTATASQCDRNYKRSYSVRHTFGNIFNRHHVASLIDSVSAWSAASHKFSSAWVQIDLGKPTLVNGVVTQGRGNANQWVTTFKVGTSTDGKTFDLVNNGALFSGNRDRHTKKENYFGKREARFVRIYPVDYHGWVSLRADVLVEAGPKAGLPGLRGEYYHQSTKDFQTGKGLWFDQKKLKVTRIDRQVNFPGKFPGVYFHDYMMAKWTGRLLINNAGTYYLYTRSDDGSKAWVNGKEIVNNPGIHPMVTRFGQVNLAKGYHNIELQFYEHRGGQGMIFYYKGPDTSNRQIVVPSTALSVCTSCNRDNKEFNFATGTCKSCPNDFFFDTTTKECKACPFGTKSNGKTTQCTTIACKPGEGLTTLSNSGAVHAVQAGKCDKLILTGSECEARARLAGVAYAKVAEGKIPSGCVLHTDNKGKQTAWFNEQKENINECSSKYSCLCNSFCNDCAINHFSKTGKQCDRCPSGQEAPKRKAKACSGDPRILELMRESETTRVQLEAQHNMIGKIVQTIPQLREHPKLVRDWATNDVMIAYEKLRKERLREPAYSMKTHCKNEKEKGVVLFPALKIGVEEEVDDRTCIDKNRNMLVSQFCEFRTDLQEALSGFRGLFKPPKSYWPNICCKSHNFAKQEACQDPSGTIPREAIVPFSLSQGANFTHEYLYGEVVDTLRHHGYLHQGLVALLNDAKAALPGHSDAFNELATNLGANFRSTSLCGPRILRSPANNEDLVCQLFHPYPHLFQSFMEQFESAMSSGQLSKRTDTPKPEGWGGFTTRAPGVSEQRQKFDERRSEQRQNYVEHLRSTYVKAATRSRRLLGAASKPKYSMHEDSLTWAATKEPFPLMFKFHGEVYSCKTYPSYCKNPIDGFFNARKGTWKIFVKYNSVDVTLQAFTDAKATADLYTKGEQGEPGRNGKDGAPGAQGPTGPQGPVGKVDTKDLSLLKSQVKSLERSSVSQMHATFGLRSTLARQLHEKESQTCPVVTLSNRQDLEMAKKQFCSGYHHISLSHKYEIINVAFLFAGEDIGRADEGAFVSRLKTRAVYDVSDDCPHALFGGNDISIQRDNFTSDIVFAVQLDSKSEYLANEVKACGNKQTRDGRSYIPQTKVKVAVFSDERKCCDGEKDSKKCTQCNLVPMNHEYTKQSLEYEVDVKGTSFSLSYGHRWGKLSNKRRSLLQNGAIEGC